MPRSTRKEWFQRFSIGNFKLEVDERSGQPKKFEGHDLEQLFAESPCETQSELVAALRVTQQNISSRLKKMENIKKRRSLGSACTLY